MHAKHIAAVATLIVLIVAMSGCTTSTPVATPTTTPASQFPMNVTDSFGRTATITKAPERIISLSPANTEILFDLGLGSKIVGNTDYCDYPAEAKNITHVAGYSTFNYEMITAASPDVIFSEDINEEGVKKLGELGFPVIALKNHNLTAIRQNILLIGKATGSDANATAMVASLDSRINNISSKTSTLNESQRPTVLLLAGYVADQPMYVYGKNTYGDELITLAGGRNAAGNVTDYEVMTSEAIIAEDPDFIIVPVDGVMTTPADYENLKNGNVTWMKDLKAIKNGHVYLVDGNLMMRPGPRLADAGLLIATAVHPELFK